MNWSESEDLDWMKKFQKRFSLKSFNCKVPTAGFKDRTFYLPYKCLIT